MNIGAAKAACKTFISANTVDLLSGLTTQGVNRTIQQLTTSISPPRGYYWVAVECQKATSFSMPAGNVGNPPEWARYDIIIHVSDYAIMQVAEDEPYETMHAHFDKLCSRIVRLFRPRTPGVTWVPSSGANPRFQLRYAPGEEDRVVTVDSLSMVGQVPDGLATMLYAQIRFQLYEECVDLTLLDI